jgi:pyruvate/2-oxoglutarate dehydrogenase complex dihydrolipoamide acyltransferase (E2) component
MDVKIPSQGVGMTEAVVTSWLKQAGDMVAEGEAIAEIETDKTTIELLAPCAGRLGPLLANPGDVVEVGVTIATVET